MKKLATAFIVAGLGLFALVPSAFAKSNNDGGLPNGTHLKVDICHNVDHNPHVVPVSINAAKASQETGHGLLTLDADFGFVSFLPHVGTGGHEHDFVVRVYTKHGNTEVNTYVSETECAVVTTTTTQPPTTTTTQPEVTTTTTEPVVTTTTTEAPVVTTTTEAPVVTTTTQPEVTTTTTAPGATVTTAPAPTVLAHTGAWSTVMALFGAAAALLGIGLVLMGKSLKHAAN